MVRLLLVAAACFLLSGCAAAADEDVVVQDVALQGHFSNEGDLAVAWRAAGREFQPDVPPQDQDGRILWQTDGNIPPGETDDLARVLAAEGDYWIEVYMARDVAGFDSGGAGMSFHVDPKACQGLMEFTARAGNSLTSWGSTGELHGCGN